MMSRSTKLPLDVDQFDKENYRNGMARLAAAVNIVTTNGPAGQAGFTASAVCSVTDAPPTLLVCINRSTSAFEAFRGNTHICVNTLGPDHEELSRLFGGKTPMQDRFAAAAWHSGQSGAPILNDATVSFDCRIVSTSSVGTHDVMVCQVISIEMHEIARGLMYFNRRYHHV